MSTQSRIRDLVQTKLAGRKIDVVGFVDELLSVANEAGDIRCCLTFDQMLRFELRDGEAEAVELDAGQGKLRMLCARLSVLCNESGGDVISPYGGAGFIRQPAQNGTEPFQWTIHFKNTPDAQEFTIVPAKVGQHTPQVTLRCDAR